MKLTTLFYLIIAPSSIGSSQDVVCLQPTPTNHQTVHEKIQKSSFQTRIKSIERPATENGEPLQVHVGFLIESIGSIQETEMSYPLDIYLYQSWRDQHMAHNLSLFTIDDQESLNEIWLPDLYFANAKSALFQTVSVPNFAMHITPDGTMAYSARITMSLSCNLNLKNYPHDSQTCSVKLLSYGSRRDDVDVKWFSRHPLRYDTAISLPEFSIAKMEATYCNGSYKYALTETGNRKGEFSCLLAKIYFERGMEHHLVQTYIPSGMVVIISWVSFWIDPNAVPARVSLSITTLLTLVTQGTGLRYTLQPVSYAKAIDYWYGTCMLFLFAALIEFAVVNTMMRRAKKFEDMALQRCKGKPKARETDRARYSLGVGDAMELIVLYKVTHLTNHHMKRALSIDRVCRIVFPGSFGIFLFFYWLCYKVL